MPKRAAYLLFCWERPPKQPRLTKIRLKKQNEHCLSTLVSCLVQEFAGREINDSQSPARPIIVNGLGKPSPENSRPRGTPRPPPARRRWSSSAGWVRPSTLGKGAMEAQKERGERERGGGWVAPARATLFCMMTGLRLGPTSGRVCVRMGQVWHGRDLTDERRVMGVLRKLGLVGKPKNGACWRMFCAARATSAEVRWFQLHAGLFERRAGVAAGPVIAGTKAAPAHAGSLEGGPGRDEVPSEGASRASTAKKGRNKPDIQLPPPFRPGSRTYVYTGLRPSVQGPFPTAIDAWTLPRFASLVPQGGYFPAQTRAGGPDEIVEPRPGGPANLQSRCTGHSVASNDTWNSCCPAWLSASSTVNRLQNRARVIQMSGRSCPGLSQLTKIRSLVPSFPPLGPRPRSSKWTTCSSLLPPFTIGMKSGRKSS